MANEVEILERGLPFKVSEDGLDVGSMRFSIMQWAAAARDMIPPHWSQARDTFLRKFYADSDPIKVTVGTFVHKVSTIPMTVVAKDRSVSKHVRQARVLNESLVVNSGLFRGLRFEIEKMINDYLTQDKGCFAIIMGAGREDGAILGPALGLYHLDAEFCNLTGDPTFPVVYVHDDGDEYKLHYTRVIHIVNLPSPKRSLRGVGMCPLSCVLDSARELKDMAIYSQESYGSRPARRALYVKKGATMEQLNGAVQLADDKMDSQGLTRFAKTLLMAPKNPNSELELETLDLVNVPEGHNRKDVTLLDMAFLAAGFGLLLNDLALAFAEKGGSEASASTDRKGWGKGVALFVDLFSEQINAKFLPSHLRINTDNVDDAQDKYQAEIRSIRSEARTRDLTASVTTLRVERERMLELHEITEEQFEDMELLEGRLPNGIDVFSLFESDEPLLVELLELGVEDPTVTNKNDATTLLDSIHEKVKLCWKRVNLSSNSDTSRTIRHALAALEKLRAMYQTEIELQQAMAMQALAASIDGTTPDTSTQQSGAGDEEVINDQTQLEAATTNAQVA